MSQRYGYILTVGLLLTAAIGFELALGYTMATESGLLLLLGGVGLVGLIAVVAWWRLAVYAFFILVVIEGIVRLILYTNPAVLLVKDGLLIGIYIGCWLSAGAERGAWARQPLTMPLLALLLVGVVQLANPYGNLAAGLVGLKVLLLYTPLIYLGYHLAGEERRRRRTIWVLLGCAILASAVGMAQIALGPSVYASLGPGFREATFTTLGAFDSAVLVYRPNSTFSYSSHYASFLLAMFFLALAHANSAGGIRHKALASGALLLIGVATLTVGQRSFYLLVPAGCLAVLIAQGSLTPLLRFIPAGALALALALSVAGPAISDRAATVFSAPGESVANRYLTGNIPTYFAIGMAGSPLGNGVGSATLAARHVISHFAFIENYYAKLIYELSFVGLAIFLWLYLGAITLAWQAGLWLPPGGERWLALSIAAYLSLTTLSSLSGNSFDYPVPSVYVWLFAGMALRLREQALEHR